MALKLMAVGGGINRLYPSKKMIRSNLKSLFSGWKMC